MGKLNRSKFQDVIGSETKKIKKSHWIWLKDKYQSLPDNPNQKITAQMLAQLERHIRRTGKGAYALLNSVEENPYGIISQTVEGWRTRKTKTCSIAGWNWFIEQYEKTPDISAKIVVTEEEEGPKRMKLTKKMLHEFQRLKDAKGTSFRAIFMNNSSPAPEGFSDKIISNWYRGLSKTAPEIWVNWLTNELA